MKCSIFFPLRAGSTRAVRKNTRPFLKDGTSLFQHKIKQLILTQQCLPDIVEIIISTNDPEVIEQAAPYLSESVKLVARPESLCMSTTKVSDLISYVPSVVRADYIFWVHATSPFISSDDYIEAFSIYRNSIALGCNDSMMSVNEIRQFIWDASTKNVINVDRSINPWPNTQDLKPLYEINHAFYISSKANYLNFNDRIGKNPNLYVCEGSKKIDIDWEEDFRIAQVLAEHAN